MKIRDPAPVILEGDPQSFIQICESINFKNKYTSGVLTFSLEETLLINSTPGLKDEIFQDFKDFAFAGIAEDCRNILAVEHTHTEGGRLEIHYVIPRVNMETGKYWNPFEPNYDGKRGKGNNYKFLEQNDAYVDYACIKFGLQNPRDLSVARDIKISKFDRRSASKREVHGHVVDMVISGHITCREDIEGFLKEAGGKITRRADDYISVKFGDRKAMRFEGGLYDKNKFGAASIREKGIYAEGRDGEESVRKKFSSVMDERIERVERRNGATEKYSDRDEAAAARAGEGLSADAVAVGQIQKTAADIPGLESGINNFIIANFDALAEYQKVKSGDSGVEVGDIVTAQSEDPVVLFFQQQFKKQEQRLQQQAIASSSRRWASHGMPQGHDKALADGISAIFRAMIGIRTGADPTRPGGAYTRAELHQDAAEVAKSTLVRMEVLEAERKRLIHSVIARQADARIANQEAQEHQAREGQVAWLPSWKRQGYRSEGEKGYKPGG